MTAAAWISLASLAAFVFGQAILFAFLLGRLFQDVATLKTGGPERAVQGLAIARLEVKMEHVSSKIDEISGKIDSHPAFHEAPARKSRAGA